MSDSGLLYTKTGLAKPFKITARGILLLKDGKGNDIIFLCQNIADKYYFLPGGIVEHGESAQKTVEREVKEEFGFEVKAIECVGIFEQVFQRDKELIHDYSFVFDLKCKAMQLIAQNEQHIVPAFIPVKDLKSVDFRPKAMCNNVLDWIEGINPGFISVIK